MNDININECLEKVETNLLLLVAYNKLTSKGN